MSFNAEIFRDREGTSVLLKDFSAGTEAVIFPECGGILNSFRLVRDQIKIDVLDGYENQSDFKSHAESRGFRSCKLSPYVGRIPGGRYKFAGKEYTIGKFRLQDSVIHGLLYNANFSIVHHGHDDQSASLSLQFQYGGGDPGYPFAYTCTLNYKLEADHLITLATTIQNTSGGLIPMSDGWHPYFRLGEGIDHLQLEFQSKEMLEFNEGLVPTGKSMPYSQFNALKNINDSFFDNSFTLNFAECQPLCLLRDPVQKIQVEIRPDKSYPYLQVYTPPHRKSIALENLSAAPNAFNNQMGLLTLEPGEIRTFQTQYKISSWA